MKRSRRSELENEVTNAVLPMEVRRAIDDKELPAAVEPVLLKVMAGVARMEALSQDTAREIEKIHIDAGRNLRRVIPFYSRLKRDVHDAKRSLSGLATSLKRLRTVMFDLEKTKREDDVLAGLKLRLDALGEELESMVLRPPVRPRGAPPVPRHFYELGALAVLQLALMGVSRSDAAMAVTACLRPILPKRGEGKTQYKFTGRLLLKWMRAEP